MQCHALFSLLETTLSLTKTYIRSPYRFKSEPFTLSKVERRNDWSSMWACGTDAKGGWTFLRMKQKSLPPQEVPHQCKAHRRTFFLTSYSLVSLHAYPIACKSSEPSIRATHIKVPAFFASVNVGRTPDTLCSRPYAEEQKNAWEPEGEASEDNEAGPAGPPEPLSVPAYWPGD